MGQATREAVIRLRVEQKLDKPKMPSLAPINKWRDAQIAAQKKVEQHAIASERRIQASLDQTIRRLQQIVALQNQRASGGGGRARDARGRFTRGAGIASMGSSALGLMGGAGGLTSQVATRLGLSDERAGYLGQAAEFIIQNRRALAQAGRSAVAAVGGGAVIGGGLLATAPITLGGGIAWGHYREQQARAEAEGRRLDAIAQSRNDFAARRSMGQIGALNNSTRSFTRSASWAARGGDWQGLLASVQGGPLDGLVDADAITGRSGFGLGLAAHTANRDALQARLEAVGAGRSAAIAESRSVLSGLQADRGGLIGAIRNRDAAQSQLQSARNALAGTQAGYATIDAFDLTSLRNAANAGLSGASIGDLQVAARYGTGAQRQSIVDELGRRGAATGRSELLDRLTGIRTDAQVTEAEAALGEAAAEVSSQRTAAGYGTGERGALSDEEVVADMERRVEQYRQEYERSIRAFDELEEVLLRRLEAQNDRIEQLQQALEAQAGAA